MYCVFCGEKLEENFIHCPHCGNKVIKIAINQNFVSTPVNEPAPRKVIENNGSENAVTSSDEVFWKHIHNVKKISKPVFFILCIIFFYVGTYLTIIPNTPNILALILLIVLLALNFYLVNAYGRNLKSLFQMLTVTFFSTFFSIYVNYDYTVEEYINKILGIDGILDDTLMYATFLTGLSALCYYAMLGLHMVADQDPELENNKVSKESEGSQEDTFKSYKHVKGEGLITWLKKELF
ncbi:zinc ribbon domain-containing protein [Planococcus sp. S3-L1]|uniref:zinc ribbon domain-containing protein n=1 Tax=Planococcus sp. S3-L1 TaxID=3046200 RepID=UPI0024BABB76|nr:zinc ribbon domain-containing protein [Planococcus sp. S3-L1]MDJ0333304.1 zinc ribbon domain-containing protein [Planococcus sp. S3-L1]